MNSFYCIIYNKKYFFNFLFLSLLLLKNWDYVLFDKSIHFSFLDKMIILILK